MDARDNSGSLNERLSQIMPGFLAINPPQHVVDAMRRGRERLEASAMIGRCLRRGDKAPPVELASASGETLRLDELLRKGPVVLSFFRGVWCNPCKMELEALEGIVPRLRSLGAEPVAVSPQSLEYARKTVADLGLSFAVCSDPSNRAAGQFGIVHDVDDDLYAVYRDYFKVDLEQYNGDRTHQLPLTSTYIIGTDSRILYDYLNYDYMTRLEPARILEILGDPAGGG